MSTEKNRSEKTRLHPRNKNREQYDLSALTAAIPELAPHVKPNKYGLDSIDFSDPVAVKLLNAALLKHYYGIEDWEFPAENLCPAIPGRADYIHHMADLLAEYNYGVIPVGHHLTCLDIGVGASCVYPIIGVTEYGWSFIGTDVDAGSLAAAERIARANPSLSQRIELRLQADPTAIFQGILAGEEKIDLSFCNPPFHASAEAARQGTRRKVKNLSGKSVKQPERNFGGIGHELVYEGGERAFIHRMIRESTQFAKHCFWFSTLVSKQANLKGIYQSLDNHRASRIKTIPLGTGNKSTRIVAWTFLSHAARRAWLANNWRAEN